MVSSILTPGTIFLMIVGSLTLAFPVLNLYWSMIINLTPIIIFVLLIFRAKSDLQVKFNQILLMLTLHHIDNLNFNN